jgi:hypothetical protein
MAKGKGTSASKVRRYANNLANHTKEKNKIKKLIRYLKVHPNNLVAQKRLNELKTLYP